MSSLLLQWLVIGVPSLLLVLILIWVSQYKPDRKPSMQVIVLDDDGQTVFVYDDSDDHGGKVPDGTASEMRVRDALREAIDFFDDNTGRSGESEE